MKKKLLLILALIVLVGAGITFLANYLFGADSRERLVEDPYWGVSQYNVALLKLKANLLEISSGDVQDDTKAKRALAVLTSKSRLLTRDSPSHRALLESKLFADNFSQLRNFEAFYLEPYLEPDLVLDGIAARAILSKLDEVSMLMDDILPDMWLIQGQNNDAAFATAQERAIKNIYLSIAAASIAVMSLAMFLYYFLTLNKKNVQLENQKAQLSAVLAEKNRFMGVVSHELKSPLQTISLSAESLLQDLSPKERIAVIKRLQRGATSLQLQLNDLLTLARSESGKLEYRPDVFEVTGLVEEIVDVESQAAYEKSLAILVDVPKEPIFALADSGRISQILRNLVSNAIKYTDQGKVEIKASVQNKTHLFITVRDTGPGISKTFTPRKLEPFTRYGALSKREGYGIGLMIAFSLAEYLGGKLEYSSDDRGTTFELSVPIAVQDDAAEQLGTGQVRAPRVLLVDDMPDLLQSLRMACKANGIEADSAESAAEAANMMAGNSYDAALIDINMPIRRGDELARDFRRGSAMANKSCLLIGMSADRNSTQRTRDMPFDYLLEKPIRIKGLLRILQQTKPIQDSTTGWLG